MSESDSELDRAYRLGESSGLSMAAKYLMDRATRLFQVGDDSMAKELRKISRELSERGAAMRPRREQGEHD